MEECCVVCAEPLQWVGYGVCGHRDVCSRCIARLRFVLNDKHCCICKQECSSVFVTKALGNYTKVIKDFELLPKNGDFWYEKNTQAFFDDKDHFVMVKAMCHLSCRVCEQAEASELNNEFVRKGHVFKTLDLLQRHFLSAHKVEMCSLCLEGRKIFICEQKLYNKMQLERHSAKGDSEIDGIGQERGGFTGHPLCNFCQKRFYSDNELYHHMSVDHYLCHICQRLRPGQYDYFHNYDDLEVHFRHEHSLCEHPDCLAKKFVVFKTDAELKRHNALTHGGNMSRSQRNTYLQIPVSFQYRRPPISGRGSALTPRNQTDGHVSMRAPGVIFLNSETGGSFSPRNSAGFDSTESEVNADEGVTEVPLIHERSGYRTAAGGNMPPGLEESAFPPLPGSKSTRRKKQRGHGCLSSTNGALQGSARTSTPPYGRVESSPCSSSVRSVTSSNEQLQVPGREACIEGVVNATNITNAINIANTALLFNEAGHETKSPTVNGYEHGFQLTDEVRSANKALGECIRSRLGDDSKLFMAFKDMSAQFRKGKLDAVLYCKYIKELSLSDLVPELARLCPEPDRQRDLLNAFRVDLKGKKPIAVREGRIQLGKNLNIQCNDGHEKGARKAKAHDGASAHSTANSNAALRLMDRGGTRSETNNGEAHSRNGYCEPGGGSRAALTDSKSRYGAGSSSTNNDKKKRDVLLENGRVHVDSSNQVVTSHTTNTWSCGVCTLENSELENKCAACETSRPSAVTQSNEKRTKKISKFDRLRLDKESPSSPPVQLQEPAQKKSGGVWKNGGGHRLVALAQRDAVIDSAWRRPA